MNRLSLEHDHAQFALGELTPVLYRVEQLAVVEMPVAEVPPVDHAGDDLPITDVVGIDVINRSRGECVEGAAMAVHGAEGQSLLDEVLGRLATVELGQLLHRDPRDLARPLVKTRLGLRVLAKEPQA